MSIAKLTLGVLVVGGMVFTVWDYRQWKTEETKNYGHGWEANIGVAPAQKLGGIYTNGVLKFRIKYPQDWEAKGMTFSEPFGRARVTVTVVKDTRDLPVIADEAAGGVTQDRGYVNTDSASLVVLTWEGTGETKQLALAKKENRLYKIEITCESGIWKAWSATFEEIYRSLVLL